MAKNTHSQEVLTGTSDSFTNHETTDPHPPYQIQRAMLGQLIQREGDEGLAGTDFSEHSSNAQQSSVRSKANPHEPAQTTGNPSSQTEQTDSSARSTVGGGHGTAKRQSGRRTSPRGKANIRITDDEEDEFSEFK